MLSQNQHRYQNRRWFKLVLSVFNVFLSGIYAPSIISLDIWECTSWSPLKFSTYRHFFTYTLSMLVVPTGWNPVLCQETKIWKISVEEIVQFPIIPNRWQKKTGKWKKKHQELICVLPPVNPVSWRSIVCHCLFSLDRPKHQQYVAYALLWCQWS